MLLPFLSLLSLFPSSKQSSILSNVSLWGCSLSLYIYVHFGIFSYISDNSLYSATLIFSPLALSKESLHHILYLLDYYTFI